MSQFKPSRFYVEKNAIRLIALQVAISGILLLITKNQYIALLLLVDFTIRALSSYPSPLALIAKGIVKFYNWKQVPQFAPPKKFAASIGLVSVILILVFWGFRLYAVAFAITIILILFASLEALFQICIGCYVYNWLNAGRTKNNKAQAAR